MNVKEMCIILRAPEYLSITPELERALALINSHLNLLSYHSTFIITICKINIIVGYPNNYV